ncbi:MAG: dihydrodipicolinate reductase [Pseudomonadota bacterium]
MSARIHLLATSFALFAALPAMAMEKISDRGEFVDRVEGQVLQTRYLGVAINLQVFEEGQIVGRALGADITGDWAWQDGYFCREMSWGSTPIPYNCQLVEYNGAEMRFTTDRGAGRNAVFDLR